MEARNSSGNKKTVVDKLPAGTIVWDTKVTGFGARRQREAGGVHYVLKSKDRWHTIGKHGSPFTVEVVRAEALRLLGLIVSSKDPRSARCKKCRERALREGQSARGMCNPPSGLRKADAPIFVENVKAGIAGRRCYAASTFSSSSFAVPFLLA